MYNFLINVQYYDDDDNVKKVCGTETNLAIHFIELILVFFFYLKARATLKNCNLLIAYGFSKDFIR